MSLTQQDLQQIRDVVEDTVRPIVRDEVISATQTRFDHIDNEIVAIHNDLEEIYTTLTKLDRQIKNAAVIDPAFRQLPVKEQLLQLNSVLITLAKQAGVTLPR